MTREFVIMPEFEKQWSAMGLSDKELSSLQYELTICLLYTSDAADE